jgi:hypothetical protein
MPQGPTPPVQRLAGAAALGAVVLRAASILTWPPDSDGTSAQMVATAAEHPTAWNLATWAEVGCWLLAGLAALAVVRLVDGRGRWLTRIGGWVHGSSLVTLALVGGAMNAVTGVLAQEPDRALMVRVVDDLHDAGALLPFVLLVVLGEHFAIVLAAGLARARLVGWWFPGLALLGAAAYVLTSDSSDHAVVLAGFAPIALFWVVLARLLLTGASRSDRGQTLRESHDQPLVVP